MNDVSIHKAIERWLPRSTIFGTAAKPARSTRQVELVSRIFRCSWMLLRLAPSASWPDDAGSDPNKAQLRDAKIVEGYVE